jgi:hypothetical protein
MMDKHRSITKLKKYYKTLVGEHSYKVQLARFRTEWEQHHQPMDVIHPEIKEFRECAIQTDEVAPVEICLKCEKGERVEPVGPAVFWGEAGQLGQYLNSGFYFWMQSQSQPQ